MKLIKRTVALLFALVVAGTAAIPSLADEPLLRNGGLEEIKEGDWDPDAGEEPLHWDVWPGNPAEGTKHRSISTSIKHGGKQSLCVELSDKNKQAVYQYAELKNDPFDFNKSYTFSVWIKMENVQAKDDFGVKIGFNRKGFDGNRYDMREDVDLGTYDWKKFSVTVPKPVATKMQQFDVIVDIGLGSGKIYLDDFEMVEAASTSPTTAKPTTQAPANNNTTKAPANNVTTKAPDAGTTVKPGETTASVSDGGVEATTEATAAADATTGAAESVESDASTTPVSNDDGGGFNALPLIIIGAVVVAAGAVVGAYFLIKKNKGGPSKPMGSDNA